MVVDDRCFDDFVRSLATAPSRRTVLKGALAIAGTVLAGRSGSGVDAARRPLPSPTPARCPGTQHWNGTACSCDLGETKCGPACCPNGVAQCCDNACCFGTCYGEELCCPAAQSFCSMTNECCPPDEPHCCSADGCCANECCSGINGLLCCDGATPKCCGGNGNNVCIASGGCCSDADCEPVDGCTAGVCVNNVCSTVSACSGATPVCCEGTCAECCTDNDCPVCDVCTEAHTCEASGLERCGDQCCSGLEVCCNGANGNLYCTTCCPGIHQDCCATDGDCAQCETCDSGRCWNPALHFPCGPICCDGNNELCCQHDDGSHYCGSSEFQVHCGEKCCALSEGCCQHEDGSHSCGTC